VGSTSAIKLLENLERLASESDLLCCEREVKCFPLTQLAVDVCKLW